jgi:putative membrane protein
MGSQQPEIGGTKKQLAGSDEPTIQSATERTLMSWVRTALALIGFGFIVARFGLFLRELATVDHRPPPAGHVASVMLGIGLAGLGLWVLLFAWARHRRYTSALEAGRGVPPPNMRFGIWVAVGLTYLGLLVFFYLVTIG